MALSMLIIFASGILIGVMAQKTKGRTGIAWALIAWVFLSAVYGFMLSVLVLVDPKPFAPDGSGWGWLGILTFMFGVGILGIVVKTLPNRPVVTQ